MTSKRRIQLITSSVESQIPITQEVYRGKTTDNFMTVDEIRNALKQYQPSKVGGSRKIEFYGMDDLKEIAKLLKIDPAKLNKENLANEILIAWKKKYPEQFEN